MNIPKTTRRKGFHTAPVTNPNAVKLKSQIGNFPKMKLAIKAPKLPKVGYGGFPKGHVY